MKQLTHTLRQVNAAECFGDLRLDFCVDSSGQYWLTHVCSNDYLEFMPLDDFEDSPHKTRYLAEMTKMQNPVFSPTVSDYERKKKCGFCGL